MPPSGGAKLHSQKYGLLPLIVACNPHSQSIEIHGCVSFKRAGQVDNVGSPGIPVKTAYRLNVSLMFPMA
jgi:hypothetical protein